MAAASALLLLGVEIGLRATIFTPLREHSWRAQRLRHPGNFAHSKYDDDYWKLQYVFDRELGASNEPNVFHPTLGWVRAEVDPRTYARKGEKRIEGRRKVLLYGDSFAQCETGQADCWEGLLEHSKLGRDYAMLNYGTGGYGLDQTILLMLESLPLHARDDPVVVLSTLIDDDLDRCALSIHGWPKPRLVPQGEDGWRLTAPRARSMEELLERDGIGIFSYAWRWLLFGSGWISDDGRARWRGEADVDEQKREIVRRLLRRAAIELEGRGLDYFFLVFHGSWAVEACWPQLWYERFLMELLEELEIPYLTSRPSLLLALHGAGEPLETLFFTEGSGVGHWNEAGNQLVFGLFERGLAGEFDVWRESRLAEIDAFQGRESGARVDFDWRTANGPARLAVEVLPGESARLSYRLARDNQRLACALALESADANARAHVEFRVDEKEVAGFDPQIGSAPLQVEIATGNALGLQIWVENMTASDAVRVLFVSPVLE